jgi:predicted outer membrane repeat protein
LSLKQCATRVINSVFEDCDGSAIGHRTGDIYTYDESLLVEGCRFIGNRGYTGGAIAEDVDGDVTVSGCWFEANSAEHSGGAVYMSGQGGTRVVEGCVFWENQVLDFHGGGLHIGLSTEIRSCTFVGNAAPFSGAAMRIYAGNSTLENCIIANSVSDWPAIYLTGGSLASSCNVFWNNLGGIGLNWTPDATDFEADPLFCDPDNGNFELSSQSPCLPPASGDCDLIGAFGEGCGIVSIEDSSWGRIKGQYIGETGGGR